MKLFLIFFIFVIFVGAVSAALYILAKRLFAMARSRKGPVNQTALDENVQFTLFRPSAVKPDRLYKILVFSHLSEYKSDPISNEPTIIDEVHRQAREALGPEAHNYHNLTSDSMKSVPLEAPLILQLACEGIEFVPPIHTFMWQGPIHQQEFQMKASSELDGKTAHGLLTVFLGLVRLAEISFSIRIDSTLATKHKGVKVQKVSVPPYRKIFISYSHKDMQIVRHVELVARALGDDFLRDLTHLRSGEHWSKRLEELIEEASVFQLFWSTNSMRSKFVKREWEYALSLNRDKFVRPTYWEKPMPKAPEDGLPPEELKLLEFYYLPISEIARSLNKTEDKYAGPSNFPKILYFLLIAIIIAPLMLILVYRQSSSRLRLTINQPSSSSSIRGPRLKVRKVYREQGPRSRLYDLYVLNIGNRTARNITVVTRMPRSGSIKISLKSHPNNSIAKRIDARSIRWRWPALNIQPSEEFVFFVQISGDGNIRPALEKRSMDFMLEYEDENGEKYTEKITLEF